MKKLAYAVLILTIAIFLINPLYSEARGGDGGGHWGGYYGHGGHEGGYYWGGYWDWWWPLAVFGGAASV